MNTLSFLNKGQAFSYLILILILAVVLRFYGLNWDQNNKLHPDERMIIMTALNLRFPQTDQEWQNVFTPQSTLNPKFFAYGNFPIYLLKTSSILAGKLNSELAAYGQIHLVGRGISAIFDIGTILVLFFLGKRLFNKQLGLIAAFFYTISVLPIQLSHFYAVDTPLTFFILLTLYQLIKFYEKPTRLKLALMGFFFGLALTTKISALLLGFPVALAFILHLLQSGRNWPRSLLKMIPLAILGLLVTLGVFVITEPYAIIDFPSFLAQTQEQQRMTKNAFTFPYTLQYVGKIPYLYEIKNIFLWGLGPILATLSFLGVLYITYIAIKQFDKKIIILLTFFWVYFLVLGDFAIGFMRYMLPLYPLLCLFAAVVLLRILKVFPQSLRLLFVTCILLLVILWPLSFINIYTKPNTRILATDWINKNILMGTTIATEHWDDGLPLGTQSNYKILEMPMYDQDTPLKWGKINNVLQKTEYIIIASNRLYTPLQKLTSCQKLPQGRCYTQTAQYYKKLFAGLLGFQKVAEFTSYPTIPLLNIPIYDQSADESFTVYDHPKVMIYKRET